MAEENKSVTEPARCFICGQLLKENERIQLEYVDYKKWWVYRHVQYGEFTGDDDGKRMVNDYCAHAGYQIKIAHDGGDVPNPS